MNLRARMASLLLAGGASLMLCACSAAPPGGEVALNAGSSMPTPNTTTTPTAAASAPAAAPLPSPPQPAEAGCDAQAVQDLVGRHASGLIAEGARQRAGAQRVRMIGHDEMVTKEYDAGRLNLQLDAQGRVARVYCG